jgi:hypothetical protein
MTAFREQNATTECVGQSVSGGGVDNKAGDDVTRFDQPINRSGQASGCMWHWLFTFLERH